MSASFFQHHSGFSFSLSRLWWSEMELIHFIESTIAGYTAMSRKDVSHLIHATLIGMMKKQNRGSLDRHIKVCFQRSIILNCKLSKKSFCNGKERTMNMNTCWRHNSWFRALTIEAFNRLSVNTGPLANDQWTLPADQWLFKLLAQIG